MQLSITQETVLQLELSIQLRSREPVVLVRQLVRCEVYTVQYGSIVGECGPAVRTENTDSRKSTGHILEVAYEKVI